MQNAIVIDENGYKVEFVRAEPGVNETGESTDNIMHYTLKEGESVIYDGVSAALFMYAPQWDGEKWVETGSPPEPDIEALKQSAKAQTKAWVNRTLGENPLEYDGKLYNVTDEKQSWLTRTILLGDIMVSNGIPEDQIELPWNESGESHVPWKLSDLKNLALAIGVYVTPFIEKQQEAEKEINEAVNCEQIEEILHGFVQSESNTVADTGRTDGIPD